MVHGLDKFLEYFKDHTNQYVFIGGTACDLLMEELGAQFRATKDIDMVLIVEALDASFGETFWKFIEDGDYEHREKSNGKYKYYRFKDPKDNSFPKMIELFSKQPDSLKLRFDTGLTPIHIDDSIVSLSAIILSDDYYDLLTHREKVLEGYSLLEIEIVILFKIKAYLDMKERKESGELVDSRDIKKHKNDTFRLLSNVVPSSRVEISVEIQKDLVKFIDQIRGDEPDLKSLGIRGYTLDDMLDILQNVYLIPTKS